MKIWKIIPSDEDFARQLAKELKLPPVVARVLSGYNLKSLDEAARFLTPRLKDISDPFLIPDMEGAVLRIWRAIETGEKILIFGDYDVDGIVSAVLLTQVLFRLGAPDVTPCLPDRREEGYGLTVTALQRCLKGQNPGLIITVDCGTSAAEAARFVKSRGIDLVITDHHEIGEALPAADALVNPLLGGDESLKKLAGVGVVFKLCHALVKYGRQKGFDSTDVDLKEFLDLVALGTVADLVPLLQENRIFVRHGLMRINHSKALAWKSLRKVASLKGILDTYHLSFCVAPRLNAAGRLDTAEPALELFMTGDETRAEAIAKELDRANRERQAIEAQMVNEAVREIDGYFDGKSHFGLVAGSKKWHIGVIGIVASRLAAKYNRPVVVIGFDEHGVGRGSGRSIEGFNILHGLNACASCLTGWGGHEMAAGLEIEEKNYEQFRDLFNRNAAGKLRDKNLCPVQRINSWINLDDISEEVHDAIERLAPFGQNNPKPVFAARNVKITAPLRVMAGKHLRFSVAAGRKTVAAVAFNAAGRMIPDGEIDLAFQIRKNSFNGSENLELNILDFRRATADGA